jgi:hypothetical protein
MIRTTSIKIWALLAHAFIIIGIGHGIATLGILEAGGLAALFQEAPPGDSGDVSSATLHLVALLSLIGQIGIIASIYVKVKATELLHILGLFLLWSSLLIFAYAIRNDDYSYLAFVTCIPFFYFTIRTLAGRYIQKMWHRVLDI